MYQIRREHYRESKNLKFISPCYLELNRNGWGLKRNVYENNTMTSDNRLQQLRFELAEQTKQELMSDFPELIRFSPEIYEAVTGTCRDSPRGPYYSRTKDEISRYYQRAIAIYNVFKNPRPHHLAHLKGLDLSELEDTGIVRMNLIDQIEWSKRISTPRNVVLGHLWRDIAAFAYPSDAESLQLAYPSLIPKAVLIERFRCLI